VTIDVLAPVPGRALPLEEVPDPVFSAALVGPGMAIDPPAGQVDAVAPVSGTLVKLHPHAFVTQTADGAGVLVHLGIDTVQLKGEGFTLHCSEGDEVGAGDRIVTWDTEAVASGGRSPICPVVALDAEAAALSGTVESGDVDAGQKVFSWDR
jgi:PTS system N-acetylglucosamine-specific IIA component